MEDKGREFLEQQVETADHALEQAVLNFYGMLALVEECYKDAVSFRGSLEAYTRNSKNPYRPAPLVHPLEKFLAVGRTEEKDGDSEPPARLSRAKRGEDLPSPYSKVGVALRILMSSNGRGLTTNEAFSSQSPDAPVRLTKGDLYRALPRLVSDNKAWRDSEGRYHAGPRPEGADAEHDEGREERLLLAG